MYKHQFILSLEISYFVIERSERQQKINMFKIQKSPLTPEVHIKLLLDSEHKICQD